MTGSELKAVFLYDLPFWQKEEGQPERRYDHIDQIRYQHGLDDKTSVYAVVFEKDNTHSFHINTLQIDGEAPRESAASPENPQFAIPAEIRRLWDERLPVKVTADPDRCYEEITELEFSKIDGKVVLNCVFWNGYWERKVAPENVVEDIEPHFFYYYSALNFRDERLRREAEKKDYNKYVKTSTKDAQKKFSSFVVDIRERLEKSNES